MATAAIVENPVTPIFDVRELQRELQPDDPQPLFTPTVCAASERQGGRR